MPAVAGAVSTPTITLTVTAPALAGDYARLRRRESDLLEELADVRAGLNRCRTHVELTARQLEVLLVLGDMLVERQQLPPSVREIGARLGIQSTNGVVTHLAALRRQGMLVPTQDTSTARARRAARSAVLSELGWQVYREKRQPPSDRGSSLDVIRGGR